MKRRLRENIEIGDRVFVPRHEYQGTVVDINGDEVLIDGPFGEEYHNLSDLEKLGGDYEYEMGESKGLSEARKKVIRLTESDIARIVKRVIKENEDVDGLLRNIIRGFDTEKPKDFTEILSDISDLIDNSESANDFKMKYRQFTNRNKKDLNRLTDDEKNQLDSFINSVMTRHNFN
jgi:hypothetical protein